MVRSPHSQQFLPVGECMLGVGSYAWFAVFNSDNLCHHFGFYYNFLSNHSYAPHLADPPSDRLHQITSENNGITRKYLGPEAYPIDLQEVSEVVLRIRYCAEHQYAPGLG